MCGIGYEVDVGEEVVFSLALKVKRRGTRVDRNTISTSVIHYVPKAKSFCLTTISDIMLLTFTMFPKTQYMKYSTHCSRWWRYIICWTCFGQIVWLQDVVRKEHCSLPWRSFWLLRSEYWLELVLLVCLGGRLLTVPSSSSALNSWWSRVMPPSGC